MTLVTSGRILAITASRALPVAEWLEGLAVFRATLLPIDICDERSTIAVLPEDIGLCMGFRSGIVRLCLGQSSGAPHAQLRSSAARQEAVDTEEDKEEHETLEHLQDWVKA